MFCKKGVLRNFAKFTGKHLCQSLFSNKVASLTPATLLKKRLWHRCFPVNFAKFLRTPFFTEQPPWVPLEYDNNTNSDNSNSNCNDNNKKNGNSNGNSDNKNKNINNDNVYFCNIFSLSVSNNMPLAL